MKRAASAPEAVIGCSGGDTYLNAVHCDKRNHRVHGRAPADTHTTHQVNNEHIHDISVQEMLPMQSPSLRCRSIEQCWIQLAVQFLLRFE